jgi:hypothetical protein
MRLAIIFTTGLTIGAALTIPHRTSLPENSSRSLAKRGGKGQFRDALDKVANVGNNLVPSVSHLMPAALRTPKTRLFDPSECEWADLDEQQRWSELALGRYHVDENDFIVDGDMKGEKVPATRIVKEEENMSKGKEVADEQDVMDEEGNLSEKNVETVLDEKDAEVFNEKGGPSYR